MEVIKNCYQGKFYVSARYCNPNGDPDLDNMARTDSETSQGIITDVAIKRRIRDYILDKFGDVPGMNVIIRDASNINIDIKKIADTVDSEESTDDKKKKGKKASSTEDRQKLACKNYWDVRTFGAVLSTGANAGQIKGAVQFDMGVSIDPVTTQDACITRVCRADGGKTDTVEKLQEDLDKKDYSEKHTMGRKKYIEYGLYEICFSVSANLAEKVGFTEDDFNALLEGILMMYEGAGRTSSKAGMRVVTPIILFKHVGVDSMTDKERERAVKLGCASMYDCLDTVRVTRKEDVAVARSHEDYDAIYHKDRLPRGVKIGFKYGVYDDIVWDAPKADGWIKMV